MAAVSPVKRILSELTRIEGVRGAILVSMEGFTMEAVIPAGGIDQEAVAAMVIGVVKNSQDFGNTFNLGDVDLITVEYANGIAIVERVTDVVLLVVLAEKGAVLGRIRYEIQKQKDRLRAAI